MSFARVYRSVLNGANSALFNIDCAGVQTKLYAELGMQDEDAKFEGYLRKKGHGASRFGKKNWKRRYFVLDSRCLSYYKDASLRRLKGRINSYGSVVSAVQLLTHYCIVF